MKQFLVIALMLFACGRSGFDLIAGDDTTGDGGGNGDDGNGDGGNGDGGNGDGGNDAPLNLEASFTSFSPSGAPAARRSSGLALEPSSPERLWIYGGYDSTFRSDYHYYVPMTNTWVTPTVAGTSPGQRERHALAWDPVGNALVVFGGQNRPVIMFVHYDTLHVYVAGTFKEIAKNGSWPAPRKDATLLWIPHLSKFLLHGGDDGAMANNRFSDLWLLTVDAAGGTGSFVQLTPGGVTPPAQSSACVVYDPAAHRLILYGGETADGVDVNTTYQYLLDTNVWQKDTPTGTPPQGESFGQCAWDPTLGRVLFYGGQFDGGAPIGGHATYDPDAHVWSTPPVAATTPGTRSDGAGVYSTALGGMIWYGGRTGVTTYASDLALMTVQPQ